MKYVYPKFSNMEIPFIRLGGAGLGNLLFIYARALVLSEETGCKMIYPTWPCIKIGPILRGEKDKRFYFDLFSNESGYISGLKKYRLLYFNKKCVVKNPDDVYKVADGSVLIYNNFVMNFDGLKAYRNFIGENLAKNLKKKNKKPLNEDYSNTINVHIRCGDFRIADKTVLINGTNNTRIPISWYANIIRQIRQILGGKVIFNVFSDGTDEELREVLSLENTRRVYYGTSIADIFALSRAKLIIASGSSFSMWARFLGNCNSISYTNQRKDFVADKDRFEIETGGELTAENLVMLQKLYR